ncbi:hypothetical protein ABPG77_002285 [Micractinium sp. CCAP 211/92]
MYNRMTTSRPRAASGGDTQTQQSRGAAAESVTTDETASALDLLALSQQPSQSARLACTSPQPGSPAVSAGVTSLGTRRQPGSPAISVGVLSPAGIAAPAASICRLQHDAPFSEAQYKAAVQAAKPGTKVHYRFQIAGNACTRSRLHQAVLDQGGFPMVEDDSRLWKRVAIRPYLPAALPAADSDDDLSDL